MTTTAAIKAGQFSSPTLSKDGRTMTVRIPDHAAPPRRPQTDGDTGRRGAMDPNPVPGG